YRMDPEVPLIIPEINPHALKSDSQLIASPNCSTTIMLMALAPLHRHFKIRRVVAATYQAASGAGYKAIQDLLGETKAYLDGLPFERSVIPHPYAFNLFLHNSALHPSGYNDEERKMIFESRKILEDDAIAISATCVRVPVLRAHSEALNVEFCHPVTVEQAQEILSQSPGVALLENRDDNRFPMPVDASGQDLVYYGRIRQDTSHPHALDLWVVGDQLLKGAALNTVQIAELLTQRAPTIPNATKGSSIFDSDLGVISR
ncbi:MAG: aspartate-semialdehyde dehydrogenase, partial [Chlamydiota bacterium]